ncbi:hypothetical protein DBR40_24690 [Pedobacter sp. KBW01]|uniref:hypothetical protein n=1 Tax=Pedobacter sp. KBW01 TaxID=2153364 RepID=UPI000F59FDC2|nr:hypothetical protein [Pedobacter sp. KBW01]RQO65074.1 hypothetical protein DBR40_24690 [Pedobacter sp. KBW01]
MFDEELYVSYFENLAIDSKDINHTESGKSFFYIDEPDDTEEFDNALRDSATSPVFLLTADQGEFADAQSNNHTQEISGQFYVLARTGDLLSRKQARKLCLPIIIQFLAKMKKDAGRKAILPGKNVTFTIDKVPYQKVGPMNTQWYGYTVWYTFTCPLAFTVSSSSWRTIT